MAKLNVIDVLSKVYGPKGLPFPGNPTKGEGHGIGPAFTDLNTSEGNAIASGYGEIKIIGNGRDNSNGTPVKKFTDDSLGRYTFMPVYIDGIELPNALLIITGEKKFVETDIIEVGTVFEKVFTRPYDISIIVTLVGEDGDWPQDDVSTMVKLWKKDDLVTLKSAVTDFYLQAKNNFLIGKVTHMDAQGGENVEIIQFDGRSNVDFELEIL